MQDAELENEREADERKRIPADKEERGPENAEEQMN